MSEWIAAGSADAPDGEIRQVSAAALIRAGGRWYAYEDECPHAECPLSADAEVDGTTLVCNCHGSEFDLETGAVLLGPADGPLRPRVVRVVGDRLEVLRSS